MKPMKKVKKKHEKIKKKWFSCFILGKATEKVIGKIKMNFPNSEIWVPKSRTLAYKGGQEIVEDVNIFDNYILIRLPERNSETLQREMVRKTPIIYFLKKGGQVLPITEEEEEHLLNMERLISLPNTSYELFDELEVVKGPYKGYVGTLVNVTKKFAHVEINFHDIRRSVIKLNIADVKKLGDVGQIKIYPEGEFNIAKDR